MSFLTLNGHVIPTAKGGELQVTELGDRERAFDGSARASIRAAKREWQFSTTPQAEMVAEQLRRLIRGEGDVWHFDGSVYSAKGATTSSGSPIYTLHSTTAGDGASVKWIVSGTVREVTKYGTGAIAIEDNTTNILAADQRDAENAPTGYTAYNAGAISADTTHFWQGAKSLKCVTDGAGVLLDGYFTNSTDPGAGSATKTYTASVYLKPSTANMLLNLQLYDVTNTTGPTPTAVTLPTANVWYRVFCSITIGGVDCRALRLYVYEQVAASGYTWYSDGFQIEEHAYATSWVDGTRADGLFALSLTGGLGFVGRSPDLTVNCWTRGPEGYEASYTNNIISLYSSPTLRLRIQTLYGGGSNYCALYTVSDAATDTLTASSFWDGAWHMITAVCRKNPESGEVGKAIYKDGALVASTASGSSVPALADLTDCTLGAYGTNTQFFNGIIDDLTIVPYAASAAQVAAWYASGRDMSDLPYLEAAGDFTPDTRVEVLGEVGPSTYRGYRDSTGWRSNPRSLIFTLRER